MKRILVLVGLGLATMLSIPRFASAANPGVHYFDCKQCHKSSVSVTSMQTANVCLQCHENLASFTDSDPAPAPGYDGISDGKFAALDSSDLFGSTTAQIPTGTKTGRSHAWGVTDVRPQAGAVAPNRALYAGFYGRYNISTGKVTCSRCHDPHGEADMGTGNLLANPKLLVRDGTNSNIPMDADKMCRACHVDFDKTDSLLINTHPMVADYAARQAARPNDLRTAAEIATFTSGHQSAVQLNGSGVGCVSCHGVHYTDSDSTTADGRVNRIGLKNSPGELLRSDGAHITGPDRNTAGTGTAQLRSNMCQPCHKYELHGQGGDNHKIGCLECHNGHDPAGTSDYMLRSASNGPIPTRFNRVNSGEQAVNFPVFNAGNSRTSWADENTGEATGFCEACHGDCNSAAMISLAGEHAPLNTNQCTVCHKHNDPADIYSFNRDASAATCGQCHGFPPYKNQPGDRPPADGVDGGYAVNNTVAEGGPYDYVNNTTHEKDETKTGHKVHAGRDIPTGDGGPDNASVDDWYFVGASGIDNCKPCHGADSSKIEGGHRINPTTRPNTFRDIYFYGIATTGGMTPAYNPNSPYTCSNVYCHTNGAPYNGASRPSRNYSRVNTTPAWIGIGGTYANGGYGSIYGTASRCADCHGNDVTTMTTGTGAQKSNSVAHLAHLGGATTLNMLKTFNCSVCHFYTASSKDALAVNAMDGRDGQSGGTGGKHVNGLIDVNYDATALGGDLAASNFAAGTGVCSTYCHNVYAGQGTPNGGQGSAMAADWDLAATDMQCDSCHGGLASDSTGNGGYGPINTDSHARHILTSGTGPKLLCAECHGAGSDAGTHAGHFDGTINMKVAVNTAVFGSDSVSICKECHGYDAEPGEVLPVWGSPATTDCATCHSGLQCGETFNGKTPPAFDYARSTGHNRPTSDGVYAQTANPAANLNCSGCHLTDHAGHWDGTSGDDMMLKSTGGFPATYAGNENAFCGACHGAAGTAAVKNINTHQAKLCVACHNVHGDQNVQMIWFNQADQLSHDPSATGKYAANVTFTNVTDFTAGNRYSYDEDDGVVGGAGEANADDICATCHTVAGGTAHNNANNSTGDHYQGGNCFTCHGTHTDATDAFRLGAGTACNDCHGFPPATGAHRNGNQISDLEVHSNTTGNLVSEDRTDCAFCHTGADLYTYDLAADQAAGGARGNHGVSQANRRIVLAAAVGYETTNFTCTTACHKSVNGDGEWDDVNGLNCNSCHYAALAPTSAGNVTASNSEAVSAVHNKHFDKNNMTCAQCHDVSYSPTLAAIRGVLTHIVAPDYSGAGNDGTLVQGRANAALDEATVVRPSMVYSGGAADSAGPNNTCTGGITTGCHASGTPDWDVTIPATSAGCVMCHTNTTASPYNPTSGVHNNSPSGPTVTGESHDGSFDGATADCVTCHTTSPTAVVANHINGTPNTGAAITVAAIAGYSVATGDCATTCHSAGTTWRYKWSTTAYATNGTECGNCHGDYATGWTTGVAPHTEFPTRGNKHNNVGNLTYPCSDCHAIGSAGYNWASKWNPNAASSHGDDLITMNQVAGTNTFAIDTVPNPDRAGCTTSACHGNTSAYNFRISTTSFTTQTVTGNPPEVLCSGCHGGTVGTNANGYWPDGPNTAGDNASEDNSGAHLKHMTVLASKVMGQSIAQLLTDNVGVGGAPWNTASSDTKQKELCTYCHGTGSNPIDATHGQTSYLPADISTMFTMWGKVADNGTYPGSYTCATVDCHFNKTTPTTNDWYDAPGNGTCIMCHVDVTAETAHTKHTSAATATTFGRASVCADCHEAATNWSTNTPPATGHLDNTYAMAGNRLTSYTGFTYPAVKGTCGTNACHNSGNGVGAPALNPTWGTTQADCTICHAATPASGAHVVHMAAKVVSYVAGCTDCHTAGNNSAHLDLSVTYGGEISAAPGNGSCTNTCHLSPQAGDWTGGSSAIVCTDCHSGSGASAYIGGDKSGVAGPNYMPQYNMHLTVPTVSGKVHTDTGLSTTCQFCHSIMGSYSATHPNGVWTADDADNTNDQNRGMFAAWTDGNPGTCATTCHTAGTAWRYKWSATAGATNGTQCDNCHGVYGTWTTGTAHATNPTRGNISHTETGNAGFPCTDCHSFGTTNGVYTYAVTSNDWAATDGGATTKHGDGLITMNSTSTSWARNGGGLSGCSNACHSNGYDATHPFPESATALSTQTVAGDAPNVSGGCTTCHGDSGSGEYAPDGSAYPDRAGKHWEHISAIAVKLGGNSQANRNASCDYCHLNPGAGGHDTNNAPLNAADVTGIKRITNKAVDSVYSLNGQGTNYVTCSNVDCHFDQPVTPHWYTDDIAPAAVTLTAEPGPEPRSIKVSWNAPGDDGNVANTTPYVYDLRMETSAVTSQNFDLVENALGTGANYAGNLPAAYKQGSLSEAIIRNLNIGTTYYFTQKSRDTVGTWSAASNTVSAQPAGDISAPDFGGANKAFPADKSQTVKIVWTPAEDHSMPITYKVWRKAESAGALDMDIDTPLLTGVKAHEIQLTSADGLLNDTIYNFGVRACDALGNCDTNDQIVSATPTAEPKVGKTTHTYRTNGSTTLVKDGAAGTAVTGGTLPRVFAPASNNTYSVTYFVDSFSIYLDNGNNPSTVRLTLGKSTNGTTLSSTYLTKDVPVGKRADRVYNFKIGDAAGLTVNSGERIAVQISEVTSNGVLVNYGSTANRGDMTVSEQIVNTVPSNPNVNATVSGANLNITWTQSNDTVDGLADTVHYDLYGSDDNGATYRYLIASKLPAGTTNYSWNTQEAGIAGSATMAVQLLAGDGYGHYTGAGSTITGRAVNNSADNVAPSAISDLVAKARPKSGSVVLTWTAPGDDEHNNGRAAYYDIRYSTSAITEGNFASAFKCVNEPSPNFGGKVENFEVTGLTPGTTYYFAIKTYDEGGKVSPISTAKSAGTDQAVGGPRCGMCHTTAPSIVESVGNHKLHGFTLKDCTKCHGAASENYGLDHQDGVLTMGYGPGGPVQGVISTTTVTNDTITYTDPTTLQVMYRDSDGYGGFGNGSYADVGDALDDGTCLNFGAMGVGGCHSGAGTDPDGAGTLFSTLPTPTWTAAAYLNCASCHGNPNRTTDYFYGRAFDATAANAGVVPDQVKAAPVLDNHGNYKLTVAAGATNEKDRKYIGQHEKHLNYSFRFSKGDSCNLCHAGDYKVGGNLSGRHANGDIDVKLDAVAAGANATWAPGTATTAGTCSNMDPESCHPSASSPKWDSDQSFDCVGCHNMGGTTPSHVTDPSGGVSAPNSGWATDPMQGNCTYCHPGGHPRDDVGGTLLILANNSQVGINYRAGGIHMNKSPGAHAGDTNGTHNTAYATEAQLCWGCHDRNSISEWGVDTGNNNVITRNPNNTSWDYNYGNVTSSNWTAANWSSPVANFSYKTGAIQSTHSTHELGTSAVTGTNYNKTETKDTVDKIRCSNCHDVHNLNKAPGDNSTGQPYLRGTWIRNPYPEDGAPWNKTYTSVNDFGAVPRGGIGNNQQGGYQIDQNNNSPTAGLSLASSAGLCTLCHGSNVDTMDKTPSENLWMTSGRNGHSNSALGGTGDVLQTTNIFGHGVGGRPATSGTPLDGTQNTSDVWDMGVQVVNLNGTPGTTRAYSYRSRRSTVFNPLISVDFAYQVFDWGVTVDAGTIDVGYHAFTCSKCHNPHASRLPKLMITNCLDTSKNTWDDSQGSVQNFWTAGSNSTAYDRDEQTANHNTAQNCHRYDRGDNVGGWNKVTPW